MVGFGRWFYNFLISLAGTPPTTVRGATSWVTTAPAATTAPSPNRTRYPQIRFCLHSGNADYVVERLERGLDDFAVLFSYPGVDRYEHIRLPHTDAWGIYLPEGDPLAAKVALAPKDLAGAPPHRLRAGAGDR